MVDIKVRDKKYQEIAEILENGEKNTNKIVDSTTKNLGQVYRSLKIMVKYGFVERGGRVREINGRPFIWRLTEKGEEWLEGKKE